MNRTEPFFVTTVYSELHTELIALLKSLTPGDWYKPTVAGAWQVRDIVAHLLDSDIRRLSFQRDNATQVLPDKPITGYRDLVDFLNDLNAVWVKAAQRISPSLLIQMHELTGAQVCELFASLDPYAPALFGVAWAGEEDSANWFDVAREYTEKWHHQQQIRDAVGAQPLYERKWLFPVLDTFLRGLPHTYRNVKANEGTHIVFTITGEAGGDWTLQREGAAWILYSGRGDDAACEIQLDQDTAWRLLTKGLSKKTATTRVNITGAPQLGEPLLGMLAVMA
jgi:uncharacterized protein (TIGR03083 family)